MNANVEYEIRANAFQAMTHYMAPGKDSPAAAAPADEEQRMIAWRAWNIKHREIIEAMLHAFEDVVP